MKWIIVTLALFTLLLVGGVSWLAYANHEDLDFLKATLEEYVQDFTGREFSIDGRFELEVSEYVTLVAENIQLGNEEWADEPMVQVERLTVSVDYGSLVSGTIIIQELALQGTKLFLEQLEDGSNNWTFGEPTVETSENLFRVVLAQARLDDTTITYHAPDLERPLEVAIVSARQEHRLIDDSLIVHVTGSVNGRAIEVDAELSTYENLLEGENVEYEVRGRFGGLAIASQGFIDDLVDPSRPTITLSVAAPNVDDVTAMLGLPDHGEGSLKLDAHLTSLDDLELEVRGNLAGLEIDVSGRASDLRTLRLVEFDITTNGPNLGRFLNLFGIDDVPKEPFQLVAHLRRSDSKLVIDDVVLDVGQATFRLDGIVEGFPGLDAANVHLNVAGPELASFNKLLGLPESVTGSFELDVAIEHTTDAADIVDALLTTAPLQLRLHGPLGDPPSYSGTRFEIAASGPNLHTVASIIAPSGTFPLPIVPEDPFSVQATVDASTDGFTIRDLRAEVRDARLSGRVNVAAQQGEFEVDISLPDLQKLGIAYAGWNPGAVPFGLQTQGAWNGDQLMIDSSRVSLGEATLDWNGVIDLPPDLSATDLELSVDIQSLANLGTFDGDRLPEVALTFNAHFDGTVPSLVMDKLEGSLGGTSFTGALRVVFDEPGPSVDANLDFLLLDVVSEQSTRGADRVDTMPVRLRLHGQLGDPPDYSGTRFEVFGSGPNLHTVASIIAPSGTFPLPIVPEDPFSVQATVDVSADRFAINDLRAEVRDASLSGGASVTAQQGEFEVEISIPHLQKLDIPYPGWQPDAVAFGLHARGAWNTDQWMIDSSDISLGDATLEWNGVFDYPPDLSATDLKLSVDIPSLANLGTFDGDRLPEVALILDAHFDGTVPSFVMDKLEGSLGGTSFTGSVAVALDGPRPNVNATLDFAVLDLRDWEDDPQDAVVESAATGRVIPDYPLPLAQFATVDGELKITAHTVHLTDVTFTDALLKASLHNGSLNISELDIAAPRGHMDGTVTILPTDRGADVHFTFGGKDLRLNVGGDLEDLAQAVIFDVDVDLSGHGATTRDLAASLSGRASIESDGGRFRDRGLSLYTGFGGELLSAINPFSKEASYTEIACVKISFEATDGQVETSPNIVVQTNQLSLISKGAIDLKTEKIDFNFKSKPRKRLSISASELVNPYIRVTGTLDQPRLTMNKRSAAIKGTTAVATAGLGILAEAAWNRTFRQKDPCK